MKPTMTMWVCVLAAGLASAQSPSIIQNTRQTMNGVRDNAAAASSAALALSGDQAPSAAAARAAARPSGAGAAHSVSSGAARAAHRPVHRHARVAAVAVAPAAAAPEAKPAEPKAVGAIVATNAPGSENAEGDDQAGAEKRYNPNGKRDPFVSPVVSHSTGSGCNTGKKCLEIGAINLRGIVHSEAGFIAVVSNGLNKAYFLRENDPVFNGYVMKITGDSIVFQETLQDRLGKTFTREVTKKITTPAV